MCWTGQDHVLLGANQDAIAEAGGIGIGQGSTLTYAHNTAGVKHAFASVSSGVVGMRSSNNNAADYGIKTGYFSQEDRDKQGLN